MVNEFIHTTKTGNFSWKEGSPEKATTLVSLIGCHANNVMADGEDRLIVKFDNEEILEVIVGHDGYESFSATAPGIGIYF
jgi:hypothetical protein